MEESASFAAFIGQEDLISLSAVRSNCQQEKRLLNPFISDDDGLPLLGRKSSRLAFCWEATEISNSEFSGKE